MVFCNIINIMECMKLKCHNPYFNRWFSAICEHCKDCYAKKGHNPYFNRWFSAINDAPSTDKDGMMSQSLF